MRQFALLAFRNVFRNARRTVMTMIIVAVGVAALTLSGGFFAYMFRELAEGTIRFGIGLSPQAGRSRTSGSGAGQA